MTTSLPLKWHGGKHYLAKRIIDLMPPHVHYVEPYFGGGAVLFAKSVELIEGHSEVVNDVYSELINFWQALQSDLLFRFFQRRVEAMPFSEKLWESMHEFGLASGDVAQHHSPTRRTTIHPSHQCRHIKLRIAAVDEYPSAMVSSRSLCQKD